MRRTKFIDEARIFVKAGDGGNGAATFRREKYVPDGGPDGGDGGRGGHVIFRVDPNLNTLQSFRRRRRFQAEAGGHGRGSNRHGKNGADCVIAVPLGTIIKRVREEDEEPDVIADLVHVDQEVIVARGGRGGRGNARFKSSVRRAPKFAELGEPGEELWLDLELKVLADVGLIGFPNAGKSTLLSKVSAARPKVADYPFTTLTPQLGVVSHRDKTWVMADIPGLVEGAHTGVGLGDAFLRHIERTRLLLHVVDAAGTEGRDPYGDVLVINKELTAYSPELARRPQILVANKMDLIPDGMEDARIQRLIEFGQANGIPIFCISAATGNGLDELLDEVVEQLNALPEIYQAVDQAVEKVYRPESEPPLSIVKEEDGSFRVYSKRVERMVVMTDLENYEALRHLHRRLVRLGVIDQLVQHGVQPGDIVKIGEMEFEYQP